MKPNNWLIRCLFAAVVVAISASAGPRSPSDDRYETELYGGRYRLDSEAGRAAYAQTLETALAEKREERDEKREAKHEEKAEDVKAPRLHRSRELPHYEDIDKRERRAMKEALEIVGELKGPTTPERDRLLGDLTLIAGTIHAATLPLLPNDMSIFKALTEEGRLRHPRVGLGDRGPAIDLAVSAANPVDRNPRSPSMFWSEPADLACRDLYDGFGRSSIPSLDGKVCEYVGPKDGTGTHGGFVVKCGGLGEVKVKFGKQYSQPFAQRIVWALGFHTAFADHARSVTVTWDPKILAEFNVRKDERFKITLAGIPLFVDHLQRYSDPFEPLSEVVMRGDDGKEIVVRPNPTWASFKAKLFKNPRGRPETVPGNLNQAFASRIESLVFDNVDFQMKHDTESEDEVELGPWDWSGEGNQDLRETRGAALLYGWLNDFDTGLDNNRLTMTKSNGTRTFKCYLWDVGVCLGRASDAPHMKEQLPNAFPWTFTRAPKPGSNAIPFDGSYHPIVPNLAFEAADIDDARWMARYMARLTRDQMLQALVGSGMPSAWVRLYYDKLAVRRNEALTDLGMSFPPLEPFDASRTFDYDPRTNGLITIATPRNGTVTAPDDGWIVDRGKLVRRGEKSQARSQFRDYDNRG